MTRALRMAAREWKILSVSVKQLLAVVIDGAGFFRELNKVPVDVRLLRFAGGDALHSFVRYSRSTPAPEQPCFLGSRAPPTRYFLVPSTKKSTAAFSPPPHGDGKPDCLNISKQSRTLDHLLLFTCDKPVSGGYPTILWLPSGS